jgi:hypothetical protein
VRIRIQQNSGGITSSITTPKITNQQSSTVNPPIPPSRHPAIPPSRHPAIPPSRHPASGLWPLLSGFCFRFPIYYSPMNSLLVIDLATLPEDGKQITGELAPDIFDLPEDDARPQGPLKYDLHVQRFESELFLSGNLRAAFEFTCVRTLHPFVQTIRLDQVPISLEIGNSGSSTSRRPCARRSCWHFPPIPAAIRPMNRPNAAIDPRYLAVDNGAGDGVETASPPREDGRWAALDAWSDPADNQR